MRRTSRAAAAAAVLLVGALALAGCGGDDVSAADPSTVLQPGTYPNGISLQVDNPVCAEAGDQFLCSLNVWYANGSADAVDVDASTTVFKDDTGSSYSGTAGGDLTSVEVQPGTRTLVLWSVRIPRPHKPIEVVWVAPNGSVAKAVLPDTTPSPSVAPTTQTPTPTPSETATPTETATPSGSATPTASPTPSPTAASPTPTKASPTPTPTRTTRSPSPSATAPTGSIG